MSALDDVSAAEADQAPDLFLRRMAATAALIWVGAIATAIALLL